MYAIGFWTIVAILVVLAVYSAALFWEITFRG